MKATVVFLASNVQIIQRHSQHHPKTLWLTSCLGVVRVWLISITLVVCGWHQESYHARELHVVSQKQGWTTCTTTLYNLIGFQPCWQESACLQQTPWRRSRKRSQISRPQNYKLLPWGLNPNCVRTLLFQGIKTFVFRVRPPTEPSHVFPTALSNWLLVSFSFCFYFCTKHSCVHKKEQVDLLIETRRERGFRSAELSDGKLFPFPRASLPFTTVPEK